MMEGAGCSKKKKAFPSDYGFSSTIFSWSVEDIFNQNLFKDKVEKIPESFHSARQYFRSYVFPLLEETRAQLCSGMDTISRAPFAQVVDFEESKPYGTKLYDVKIDEWRNRFNNYGKEPYKILPGDVFILADANPESASDLQRLGTKWTFLSVTKIAKDEHGIDSTSTHFKVRAPKDLQHDYKIKKSMFLIFLTNITPKSRIWNSLHMPGNLKIIKQVLGTHPGVEKNYEPFYEKSDGIWNEKFGPHLLSGLNASQVKAVSACLSKMHCDHKSSVELIWGPPGTGKTKTVSILLFNLLKMRCRTLVCAPTNVAIIEVASRVVKLVKESFEADSGSGSLMCPLGDILLFGNKERLKVNADTEEIYLDYRIKKLRECFGRLTGWRHCFSTMIDFLEDCYSQYQKKRENHNEIEIKEEESTEKTDGSKGETKSFLEFVRERFKCCATSLRSCLFVFLTHIPRCCILENNLRNMESLISLLDSFETLLLHGNVASEELEELFSHSVNESLPQLIQNRKYLLLKSRNECHSLLRILENSLMEIDLPRTVSEESLKLFCFQKASVIFCTATSSYKLHSVAMEPLSFVVIDEAAQLKESESTIPLKLPDIKHAILIGDECQLPAMVQSSVSDEAGFGRSLFERLSSLGHTKHLLNIQYRMHPSISFFPNSNFYHNQILDGPNVKEKCYGQCFLRSPMFGAYSFINILGGREEFDDVGHSRRNMVEVSMVVNILQNLFKAWIGSKKKLSIGVVSPYTAQVIAIQQKLGRKYDNRVGFAVKVKSVDGFQGGEEDIIIISTVRCNTSGSIGFLSKPQRVNVALTRARQCLWILGNERTLTNSESIWKTLVRDAKARQCFFDADGDKDLAKVILEAKKECDELDELLKVERIHFGSQRWKVVFSDKFLQSFKNVKSGQTKTSTVNLLLKLASGWRPEKRNVDSNCGSSLHILQQFRVDSLCIVCTIDIVKELQYMQVLKVWDILPLEGVSKLVKSLDDLFANYTDDYINYCGEKCFEGNLEVPKTWAASSDVFQAKNLANNENKDLGKSSFDGTSYFDNSKVSSSLLQMKFYCLSSSVVSHLLFDRDGRELDLPLNVTDEQLEMILFPKSTFILGQSGTGKTTILTMRLFQKEKLHRLAYEVFDGVESSRPLRIRQETGIEKGIQKTKRAMLRQLFVTVSPKLCSAVKQQISYLQSSAFGHKFPAESSLTDVNDIEDGAQFKDIPNSFLDLPLESYPLVITFHKFLMMLDGTLGTSYFERFHYVRKHTDSQIRSLRLFTQEVDYDRFRSLYWPHLNMQLTKTLDSYRVFTEITSHIKGSLQAMEDGDGKLSREDYVQLSKGRGSTLSMRNREKIYDIFQNYERMKAENGEFDLADLAFDLHCRLKAEYYQADVMDFVYIDEVQELNMSQIALFKYICKNVDEGFVFSGDTAQIIARGFNFSFQDIRAMFHKKFVLESCSNEHVQREGKVQCSYVFSLSQNFHTHAGVLNLAQSIIELLYRFFPQSIDVLKPQTSCMDGKPPVLLESENKEDAIIKIFGNSGKFGRNKIGFGAQQVILVLDDCARKKISNHVGNQALVLTIMECKGLEFQDVLLYNFLGSSPLKNKWRVIYEYMKEQDLLDSNSPRSFPSFNEVKHSIMCSELKQLYLAITRTRQRLWIWENMEDLPKPMFDYWKKKCLVQVRQLDDSLVQAMQVTSSSEEWRLQGFKLYHEHNYEMATMCFERAGDTYWERRSKATGLKAAADCLHSLNPEEANIMLKEAAETFEAIGEADSAARCFFDLGEYETAGRIYLEKCQDSEFERAAECFCLAGFFELAAEVYYRGKFFSECLTICTNEKLFDMGLQCISSWKQHVNTDVGAVDKINKIEQGFLESCALHYYELKDNKSMMKFVKAFHSMDLKLNFLNSLNCLDELLLLEKKSGNFLDAANIAKLRGDILLAADLLRKAGNFKESSTLILKYVFSNSLWSQGSKGWPLKKFSKKGELLEKAKSLAKSDSNQFYEFVCTEAEILSNDETHLCRMNHQLSASKLHQNMTGEILSARKILDVHLHLNTSEYEWEDELVLNPVMFSEDKICKNKVSIETLIYFWNCWKDKIVNIFEYLGHLEAQVVNNDCRSYGDFCLNYLGVWKPHELKYNNLDTSYLLLNSDANWLRGLNDKYVRKRGKLLSIDIYQLVSAARSYWSLELFTVGMKVLHNLEALYKESMKSSKSMFCQFSSLMYIYEIANFLLDAKFLCSPQDDVKTLQKFVELPIKHFLGYAFPVDWRESSKKSMIFLRRRKICSTILVEVILKCISLNNKLSYGQIGSVAVMILGSGKLPNDLLEQVVKRCNGNSPWKAFLEGLQGNVGSGSEQGSVPCNNKNESKEVFLVRKFHGALLATFKVKWRKEHDYISPACFLYLIEGLLIMLSCFQGYFLTTKSSFVDWFIHLDGKTDPTFFLQTDVRQSMGDVLESIMCIAQQLLYNEGETVEWIRKCCANVKGCYSLLVLRLVVIVCLLHLNFGKCVNQLFELLGMNYITAELPQEFCDVFYRGRKHNVLNVNASMIAEAFRKIGNPLVIVSLGKNCPKYICPDAIFVDMKVRRCEDILGILFPEVESTGTTMFTTSKAPNPYREVLSVDHYAEGKNATFPSLISASLMDQDSNLWKTKDKNLFMNPGKIWKIFEVLNFVDNENDQKSMVLNNPTIKVDVQNICCHLVTAMDGLLEKKPFDHEHKGLLDEAVSMLEELMQLYAALDTSEPELKNNTSSVEDLLKRLQSRRLTMEPFLNQLFLQHKGKESASGVASSGRGDEGNSGGKMKTTSATNASGTQGSSQVTENKGMIKNKFNKSISSYNAIKDIPIVFFLL